MVMRMKYSLPNSACNDFAVSRNHIHRSGTTREGSSVDCMNVHVTYLPIAYIFSSNSREIIKQKMDACIYSVVTASYTSKVCKEAMQETVQDEKAY